MSKIVQVKAREILDSRGNPTVSAAVRVEDGSVGVAAVPSGASTGSHEALELRDGGDRYDGKGVRQAVASVEMEIAATVVGKEAADQENIDQAMIELDGTANKSRLGANAILAVSLAAARSAAASYQLPLHSYLSDLAGLPRRPERFPTPMINIINGGRHAEGASDFQEYMLMPTGISSIQEQVRSGAEIFHTLGTMLRDAGFQKLVGDEGGYAPVLGDNRKPLDFLMDAIANAGYQPGSQIALGLDVAAAEFYADGQYHLVSESRSLTSERLLEYYQTLIKDYPLVSIEDGFDDDDWSAWTQMTKSIGSSIQIVGDDFFVTNAERLQKGITLGAANSILIKPNQIGTLSETLRAIKLARTHHYGVIISHRSGETSDTFIADLAVAVGAEFLKSGSMSRSERVDKYLRLIEIAENIDI